jgi:signal transduction histidine kinase
MARRSADGASVDTRPRHPVPLTAYLIALCVVPVVVAAAVALVALSRHPDNESDRAAAEDLSRRAPAVEQAVEAEGERLERLATLIARDPKFYASLTLPRSERSKREFRETLESVLRDFQRDARTPIFAATDEQGVLLSRALPPDEPTDLTKAPFVLDAVRGRPGHGVLVEMGMAYRVVAVPVTAGGVLVGSLCVGTALDAGAAGALKEAMGADVMFTIGEAVASTTLAPSPIRKSIAQRIGDKSLDTSGAVHAPSPPGDPARPAPDVDVVGVGGARYLAYHRAIDTPIAGGGPLGFVLIRPLESASSPLVLLRRDLWKAAGMGLLAALVCGGSIAAIVFVRRRRAERAHAAERAALEDRIRAEQAVLASVAASLREPASAIGSVASFLATRELGPLSEPQRDGIASIVREAASLERTALDLDDLVRLGRQSLAPEFRAGDVGALVERAAIDLIPAAARRRQTVSFSAEPGLQHERIDEVLLYRAIESIVREALAGAPEGGRVVVEAGRVNGEIAVGVGADVPLEAGPAAEAGAGQPAADDASGGRVSPVDPNAPGYLIVLARAIAEAHMGALHVRDLGHGRLAYVLRLPRTTPAPAELQPPESSADSTSPPAEGEPLSLAS